MVLKNHRMHFNPLYDQKTGLIQPTHLKKNEKCVGKLSLMAQFKVKILLVIKRLKLMKFDHETVR